MLVSGQISGEQDVAEIDQYEYAESTKGDAVYQRHLHPCSEIESVSAKGP